jgi:hypothetical protein
MEFGFISKPAFAKSQKKADVIKPRNFGNQPRRLTLQPACRRCDVPFI